MTNTEIQKLKRQHAKLESDINAMFDCPEQNPALWETQTELMEQADEIWAILEKHDAVPSYDSYKEDFKSDI